ncbi:hypothetical protein [Leptospira brenneri]|uniref:hypothetical protein n=1 Tax=Leptospira brenneri TaxID=2023182 RepID=UPI000C29B9F9|nr:hypothetical protein [Leptospira brenneri]PJZ44240.1 hypothetical protein CH361_16490 [Leptospira brenneri]
MKKRDASVKNMNFKMRPIMAMRVLIVLIPLLSILANCRSINSYLLETDHIKTIELSNTDRQLTIYKKKLFYSNDWIDSDKTEGALLSKEQQAAFNQKINELKLNKDQKEELERRMNRVFGTGFSHACMESPGPATITKDSSLTLDALQKIDFGTIQTEENKKLALTYHESLATLYTVSEIIQFGQNALYRLCEGRGNGDFTTNDYRNNFIFILKSMTELMREAKKK